jgi:hypothetical protein
LRNPAFPGGVFLFGSWLPASATFGAAWTGTGAKSRF